jgi:hypothetical protein
VGPIEIPLITEVALMRRFPLGLAINGDPEKRAFCVAVILCLAAAVRELSAAGSPYLASARVGGETIDRSVEN